MIWIILIVSAFFCSSLLIWKLSVDDKREEIERALIKTLSLSVPVRAQMVEKWRARALDDQSRPAEMLRQSSAAFLASMDIASQDWILTSATDTMQKMEWSWISAVEKWIDIQKASGLFPEKTKAWQMDWSKDLDEIETCRRSSNVWSCSYNILITSWWGRFWNFSRSPLTTWMDQKQNEKLLKDLGLTNPFSV